MLWSGIFVLQYIVYNKKSGVFGVKNLKKCLKNLTIILLFGKIDKHLGIRGVIF